MGKDRVATGLPVRRGYSQDASESPPRIPAVVVFPADVEEVVRIVKLANKRCAPLTPVVARTNNWGLHIALKGGIAVDLSGMNRILEVNEEVRTMVVEPGVTVAGAYAEAERRNLLLSIPKSCPAESSIMANLLIDGVGSLLLKFGPQSQLINGLEAVLPNGELLRCGSCASGPYWFSRVPLPDLVGLFTGWHGATGIVTKIGFPIFPKPKHRGVICFGLEGGAGDGFTGWLSSLVDLDVADDIALFTPNAGKFVSGDLKGREAGVSLFAYALVSGPSTEMIELKKKELALASQDRQVGGRTVRRLELSERDQKDYLSYPNPRRDFKRESFVGSTPTAYLPVSEWGDVMKQVEGVCRKAGKKTEFRLGVMKGSLHGPVMAYVHFDREDRDDMSAVRQLVRDVVRIYVDHGGLVWKAPPWAWKMQAGEGNLGEIVNKIKRALDPKGIMAPGRLDLSGRK